MENRNAVELVKKLLAMSEGKANSHEAQVAAMKAQELMKKYNIQVSQISDSEIENELGYTSITVPGGKSWKYSLAGIVADNFRCKSFFIGSKKCCFYGTHEDSMVAVNVYDFLLKTGNKCANNEVYRVKTQYGFTDGVYKSFVCGYLAGLSKYLSENCKALKLVVPTTVEKGFRELMNGVDSKKKKVSLGESINSESYRNGETLGYGIMNKRSLMESNV